MKKITTEQFKQKKYTMMPLPPEWRPTLGSLPRRFTGIIYGASGNGKTEFILRVAKVLANEEPVDWLSYEQQHGYDLQVAIERNKMHEAVNPIRWVDPLHGHNPKNTLFDELVAYIRKTRAKVIIIDSVDYVRLTADQYYLLKQMFGHRKILLFISHAAGRQPESKAAQKILYDGIMGVLVKNYIAWPQKSRVGGFEPYIIWDEKARELNPVYFAKLEQSQQPQQPKKRGRKPKQQQ